VPIQMLPSRVAKTDVAVELDSPCFTESEVTGHSRKRSIPSEVPTQMVPSRSSNRAKTWSLDKPSSRVKRLALPSYVCTSPCAAVAIHNPPLRSRSTLVALKGDGTPRRE
jgi:hypothetical protein